MSWLTQQDVQDYGTDLVDFSRRAALDVVAPHIDHLAQENARLRHWMGTEARHRMDQAVAQAVPDYQEIDRDPRWHSWLSAPNPLTGRSRQEGLNDAISRGATNTVIRYFEEFKNKVAAQASYYGGSSSGKTTYTRPQIQALYSAHRKGAYAGREQEWARIEADIIAAGRENRILGGTDFNGK